MADNEAKRQAAMSEFVIRFFTIDGKGHNFTWRDWPLWYLAPSNLPHSQAGVQYMADGEHIFIPWHQITASTLKETILWDDNKNDN